jgi:hypothetical protein
MFAGLGTGTGSGADEEVGSDTDPGDAIAAGEQADKRTVIDKTTSSHFSIALM